MNTAKTVCAPSCLSWTWINWYCMQRKVKKFQARIVKATQDGRYRKVKAMQWLLTHSFSGKVLAVKRITKIGGKTILELTALSRINQQLKPMQ